MWVDTWCFGWTYDPQQRTITVKKIITTQAIIWAAAILAVALVAPSATGWLLLTVLAIIALGTLKNGLVSLQT